MARPVGGWRKGERPAFRGAACSRGRRGSCREPTLGSPNRRGAAARQFPGPRPPRAAWLPVTLPPRCLPSALSRCRGEAAPLRGVGSQAASGGTERVWRGAASPSPRSPRSLFPVPRPWASARSLLPGFGCAVCGRSGAGAGAGRPSSGAAGGGVSGWLSAARSARKRPRAEAGRAAGPAAGLARLFLQRCESCHEQQLTSIVKAYLEED